MAQMGSFVPAQSAHIGVVDRVFTRIGASDDLSAGQSTFMVEMNEVAEILKHATGNAACSFWTRSAGAPPPIDGMSHRPGGAGILRRQEDLGAKTLFATHYHELTALEGQLPGVQKLQHRRQEAEGRHHLPPQDRPGRS